MQGVAVRIQYTKAPEARLGWRSKFALPLCADCERGRCSSFWMAIHSEPPALALSDRCICRANPDLHSRWTLGVSMPWIVIARVREPHEPARTKCVAEVRG